MLNCKICRNSVLFSHSAMIMNRYDVSYYFCSQCGFLQTEEPFWLEKSYEKSINSSDTGIMARNILLAKKASVFLFALFGRQGHFLDYGGGYGIFVRLMRDIGFDFYWHDLHTENIIAPGFEGQTEQGQYSAITSFETMEHFVEPITHLEKMLSLTDTILFSTELYQDVVPVSSAWHYYGLSHGQHISFYNFKTLHYIADKYDLNLWSDGHSFHLLTRKEMKPSLLSFLNSLSVWGLSSVIKCLMISLTFSDSERMKKFD